MFRPGHSSVPTVYSCLIIFDYVRTGCCGANDDDVLYITLRLHKGAQAARKSTMKEQGSRFHTNSSQLEIRNIWKI